MLLPEPLLKLEELEPDELLPKLEPLEPELLAPPENTLLDDSEWELLDPQSSFDCQCSCRRRSDPG